MESQTGLRVAKVQRTFESALHLAQAQPVKLRRGGFDAIMRRGEA